MATKKKKLMKKKKTVFQVALVRTNVNVYNVLASSKKDVDNYIRKCLENEQTKPYIENGHDHTLDTTHVDINEVLNEENRRDILEGEDDDGKKFYVELK